MSHNKKVLHTCLVFTSLFLVASSLRASEPKVITAVRIQHPPEIDGKLDDPCWRLAVPTSGFIQMDPDEGKPATEQTIVRVLYDDYNLYLGIECLDSRPDKIVTRLVPRESDFYPNDLISIVLDAFHDHQNCYGFQINPRGVQRDFRSFDDGGRAGWWKIDLAWDGLWWSEAEVTDKGWSAEIAIPFKTLRFPSKKEQTWGVNIQRFQGAKREDSAWAPITRADGGIIKVSKAGDLIGLENIKPGLHLELLPYGTTRYSWKGEENQWEKDTGLDIKYGIASNLTADVTLNPDFCHIEADPEEINLTRFELYYQEKRPFFMERSELFSPMNLFYSRRIADPKLGAKITGKVGDYSTGLLIAVDEEKGPDPTYGVFRLQKDILKISSLGIIGVGKQKAEDQYSRALGADLSLHSEHNTLSLGFAKSFNPDIEKDDWMAQAEFGRSTKRFVMHGEFKYVQPEFNVDKTGYVPHDLHVGEKRLGGYADYLFHPERFGIKRIEFGGGPEVTKRTDENRWGWRLTYPYFSIIFKNNDYIRFFHHHWYLRWKQKGYRGRTFELNPMIYRKAFIRVVRLWVCIGDQYDWEDDYFGSIRAIYIWADTRPWDNLSLELGGKVIWEYFPSDRLDEVKKVGNFRLTYLPTRDISLRIFAPINPSAHKYAVNLLFGWRYRPMSNFYLAYNERRGKDMKFIDRIIMAKVSYLWNL